MTVVSSKEFVTNEKKYFEMAIDEQIFVQRGNIMFIVTKAGENINEKKKKRLKPDDDLRCAITGKELLEKVYVSVDKFFENK